MCGSGGASTGWVVFSVWYRNKYRKEEKMRNTLMMLAVVGGLGAATAANAGVSFSFADPTGGRQMMNMAGLGPGGSGLLMYDQSAPLTLIVDGTGSGLGSTTFNARLEMNLSLGQTSNVGNLTIAPVTGSFTFYTLNGAIRQNILTGNASEGSYVRLGGTNSILFSAPGLGYTPGPALAGFLGGQTLTPGFEGVFTVTDLDTGGSSVIGANRFFNSFTANASFSGNAQVIPAPGALALLGLGGLVAARRRRA